MSCCEKQEPTGLGFIHSPNPFRIAFQTLCYAHRTCRWTAFHSYPGGEGNVPQVTGVPLKAVLGKHRAERPLGPQEQKGSAEGVMLHLDLKGL